MSDLDDKIERERDNSCSIFKEVDEFTTDADEIIRQVNKLEAFADKYSKQGSSFLAAIIGGIIGGVVGIGTGVSLGGLIISGPAGMLLGGAITILAWRGFNYQIIERETEKASIVLNQLIKQIENLPADTPPSVKQKLFNMYIDVTEQYYKTVKNCLVNKFPTDIPNHDIQRRLNRPQNAD